MLELSVILGIAAVVLGVLYVRERDQRLELERMQASLQEDLSRATEQREDAAAAVSRLQREAPRVEAAARRGAIAELIALDDHVQRALAHREGSTLEALQGGLELLAKDLDQTWRRCGLARIHPEPGAPFDPEVHEAVSSQPDPEVDSPAVAEVLRDGFCDGEHLLRAAMVAVVVPEPAPASPEPPAAEPEGAPAEPDEAPAEPEVADAGADGEAPEEEPAVEAEEPASA